MKTSEAQLRANDKYQKENIKRVILKLNRKTDNDLVEFVERTKNVQGEIKRILRESISK